MFLIASLILSLIYLGVIRFLWLAMNQDGLIDVLTNEGWSKWKNKLYKKRNKLEYILAGCAKCTAFWWALPYSVLCVLLMNELGYWTLGLIGSIIWFPIFWTFTGMVGLFSLNYKNFSDNV
jgi:hypothetical protein